MFEGLAQWKSNGGASPWFSDWLTSLDTAGAREKITLEDYRALPHQKLITGASEERMSNKHAGGGAAEVVTTLWRGLLQNQVLAL